jgi:Asp-tRNA(Asn)/Glu-tRNA(Gln) amidotransferase A subunit family amidase
MYTQTLNLSETANQIANGEIDLIVFINELCDRIDAVESEILSLIPEENKRIRLLKDAEVLLSKYPDKNKRPAFFGIPIGAKDIFRVDGFITKCGSNLPSELFEGHEAACVTKLKEQGALILGKTVTTEFAYFEPGPTKNPCNTNFTPGGSSSGSAAAVAAGIIPFAFGTQTIGSIIRPAAYCGVIGFKPSYGRILTKGVIPFSPSADHIGYFTQDIEGSILAASVLCTNWNSSENKIREKPLVIGVPRGKYMEQASPEILSAFEKQLEVLINKGCTILDIPMFENIDDINRIHKLMVSAEIANVHQGWFCKYQSLYRTNTKQIIEEGQKIFEQELEIARDGRIFYRNEIESCANSSGIDLWIAPSTLTYPPEGLASTGSPLMNLPWTYAGLPAINIPAGKNNNNLPFGLQFIGFFNQDEAFLSNVKKINSLLHENFQE